MEMARPIGELRGVKELPLRRRKDQAPGQDERSSPR